ncbi:MAG: hypothetical protein AB7G08_23935 [Hyphomicrobiaceae bacterium]
MLVKYTYPITGDIFTPEHWPVSWDKFRVTWNVKDGRAESVTIAVRTADLSGLPRIEQNRGGKIAATIHMGHQPHQDEVESIVRTAFGLLGFFADVTVDFERPGIAWEGETDEERAKLQMSSFNVGPSERPEPLPTTFDLVARCFLSASKLSDREVLLSFMAKGRRDMIGGRYIDAYYSHYFFLETQFAPGYSNPAKVKAIFNAAPEIVAAMSEARKIAAQEGRGMRRMTKLLALSDKQLIDHLVDMRGKLHHHALPRKASSWHPDKHKEFEVDALFLSFLAHAISQNQNLPVLFDEAMNAKIREVTEQEGIAFTYLVEAADGRHALRVTLPTLAPSHQGLAALDEDMRREGAQYARRFVRGYTVKSTDGSQVFACYCNHTLSKP